MAFNPALAEAQGMMSLVGLAEPTLLMLSIAAIVYWRGLRSPVYSTRALSGSKRTEVR
jgi:hypothetical protein